MGFGAGKGPLAGETVANLALASFVEQTQ